MVHQRRVDAGGARRPRGSSYRRSPSPRTTCGPPPGSAVRVSGAPGRRPRGGGASRGRRPGSASRANSSDSRRSVSRSSRVLALRVLISSTISPREAGPGEVPRGSSAASDRAAARAPGARPWPSRCRRSGGRAAAGRRAARPSRRVGLGDRGVREVDGGVGVGLLGGVPARAGTSPCRAATEARHGYMFSTAKAIPVDSSRAAMPLTNPAAYSFCQRNGGCTTTTSAPTAVRHLGRALELAPRARCPRPAG